MSKQYRFLNRETSWLDFNWRVLALAENPEIPLLERTRFLSIWATNLDEFFQIRVAGLLERKIHGIRSQSIDGQTPAQQLMAIRAEVEEHCQRASKLFLHDLAPQLSEAGVTYSDYETLDANDRAFLDEQFHQQVFPVVTPLAVDPSHPFPYISNLSLNLAVMVRHPTTDQTRFARVKIPPILPRFVVLPDRERFVPLEQVIANHLEMLFPGMEILEHHVFRVTRNADYTIDDDQAADLLEEMQLQVNRRRFGRTTRLEIQPTMTQGVLELLTRELEVGPDEVYTVEGPLAVSGLKVLSQLDRPDLLWESWNWVTPPRLAPVDGQPPNFFNVISDGDVLVHHPFDSFSSSVEEFIVQAAHDPQVLAIKQTLYRTAQTSRIMRSLMEATQQGKQVVVLVELKARFDEEQNIEWAQKLEAAGVHVVYGVVGLKTHTKVLLVIRQEGDHVRRYAHIGTGNYNEVTARVYEDLGLLTADPDLGADLSDLFNFITGYAEPKSYRKLLVSPQSARKQLTALIAKERNRSGGGQITMKMNSLVDQKMIKALYGASRKGTQVDLIVRGICCLLPGVPKMSENIRVRSLVGRYLEHSRIYRFGPPGPDRSYYFGSADLMTRNLDRRVEALTPVEDPDLQARLDEILDSCLADTELAWELGPDGNWTRAVGGEPHNSQLYLARMAERRAVSHYQDS